jgi:hypothetical protein
MVIVCVAEKAARTAAVMTHWIYNWTARVNNLIDSTSTVIESWTASDLRVEIVGLTTVVAAVNLGSWTPTLLNRDCDGPSKSGKDCQDMVD